MAFYFYFAAVTWNTAHFLLWHSLFILLQSPEMHSILWLVRKYLFQCSCMCIRMVWPCTVKTTAPSPSLPPIAVTCICLTGWVVTHTLVNNNNNNNKLFLAPHLVRAQSAYKDIKIHSFHFVCRMILSLRPAVISTTLMFHLLWGARSWDNVHKFDFFLEKGEPIWESNGHHQLTSLLPCL